MQQISEQIFRVLTRRYLFVLGFLVVLSIASYFILDIIVQSQETHGTKINISGRQRMLSQRISLFALQLVTTQEPIAREKLRRQLLNAVHLMEMSHAGLLHGNRDLNLPGNPPPQVQAIYFDPPLRLDEQVRAYLTAAKALVEASDTELTLANPSLQYLLAERHHEDLLNGLEAATAQYQSEVQKDVYSLRRLQTIIFGINLLVLLLMGVFIFGPVVRRIRREVSGVEVYAQAIVETATNGVITTDEQGIIKSFNPAAERIFHYTADEAIGQTITLLLPDLSFEESAGLRQLPRIGEMVGRRQDGSTLPVELTGNVAHLNRETLFIGIVRDITQRKQVEEALRTSEERYRLVVEGSIQGMYIHNQEGIIQFVNSAMAKILGYRDPQELLGQHYQILIAAHERSRIEGYTMALLRGEITPSLLEYQCVCKDGTIIWVQCLSSVVKWEEEPAILSVFVDITKRMRLEEQLLQARKMEAIGTLAAGIAHDFNNILAAILGYTELATYDVPQDSRTWHNLQEVLTAGHRAKDLVRQILTFSRQYEQERKPVQLHLIVREVLKLLRASIPTTIDIQQHLETEGTVLADPTQMHQVLLNLCANAAYAMRQTGGVLEIRLEAVEVTESFATLHPPLYPGPHLRLTVRDTGQGMPPEVMERIFEPFFTTKPAGEGTGMGLSVVHGIIAKHEGVITVESTPGQGTTFTIYLPRLDGTTAHEASTEGTLPLGRECILFVDDEGTLAQLGRQMLTQLGYTVVTRTSSVEALEAFRAAPHHFDLVITDQTMPNMTGEQLAKELLHLRPDIPIILCTGFSHTLTEERARELGIQAFLLKPFTSRGPGLYYPSCVRVLT